MLKIKFLIGTLIGIITLTLFMYGRPLIAQETRTIEEWLALIEENTANTNVLLKDFPELFLKTFLEFVKSWMNPLEPEPKGIIEELIGNFVNYITYSQKNDETQLNDQRSRFMKEYFADAQSLPYLNELSFTTLLDLPYSTTPQKDENGNEVDSAYNYIKNASGLNITHSIPLGTWRGSSTKQKKYENYYKTVSAVQSFNTYVLSALYADSQNEFNLSKTQKKLMELASDDKWMVSVATEELGVIMREILLFNSQTYVVLIKLLETQKQQLAAQAMGNTLLIVGNQFTESNLLSKATGES